jgi:hypothetical protein
MHLNTPSPNTAAMASTEKWLPVTWIWQVGQESRRELGLGRIGINRCAAASDAARPVDGDAALEHVDGHSGILAASKNFSRRRNDESFYS